WNPSRAEAFPNGWSWTRPDSRGPCAPCRRRTRSRCPSTNRWGWNCIRDKQLHTTPASCRMHRRRRGGRQDEGGLMIKTVKDFQIPMRVEVDKETASATFGRFSTEAYERGFGTTVGNALRRVLLSSLTRAAVTTVKIEGVLHEFSTIPGVTEDVTSIILNVKGLRLALH